ncbi:MAG TPA: winged helix-turn-helix domain-containing protein [Blastocatellia bacterium]|nr:winged helix-turn-helix domain-containing protein [Blastocatellia bacterium]
MRDGEVVPLAPKTIDLLVVLVENGGHVVSKDRLMKSVWPDTFVEEANLSGHISTLRKALGDELNGAKYIETISRRGYRFAAEVVEVGGDAADVVVEHTRAHILIEEEIEGDEPRNLAVAVQGHSRREQDKVGAPPSRLWALPIKRQTLIWGCAGVLSIGSATYLSWRIQSEADLPPSSIAAKGETGSRIKLTRMTSFGKANSSISSDGNFICYAQNYFDGVGTLWLRQVATNKEIQLIEPGERVFYGTAFSPDGQFIYYSATDQHDTEGALFRVPVLGGPATRLVEQFGSMFTLSSDGRVAFYRYSPDRKKRSLMVADLTGGYEQTLLTFDYPEQAFSGSPAFSPDGSIIAFAAITPPAKRGPDGHVSLFTIDISSGSVTPLTTELWREVGKLTWSLDKTALVLVAFRPHVGNQLYYVRYPEGDAHRLTSGIQGFGNYGLGITADGTTLVADGWERTFNIWTVLADGQSSDASRLTAGLDDGSSGLATLPDGRIAYESLAGDDADLWTMKPDGSDATALTADSYYESDVSATADGRYLVFISNRSGHDHLFRIDSDGSNTTQLTFGDYSDATPDCSPDGKWIVYASRSGNLSTIWKVPIDGGTPIQLTTDDSVEPSFSPDGNLISCILPKSGKVEKGSIAIVSAEGGPPTRVFPVVQFAHRYVTPRWSPDGQSVVFTEIDNNVGNLWKQPLVGGSPQRITNFKTDLISNFAFSRDGKRIVLSRGPKGAYAVLIRGFK